MRAQFMNSHKGTPGVNLDKIDVSAGLNELALAGYDDPKTKMVIEYALIRWRRGEEAKAERAAIDKSFHGIDYTSWRSVLAAAMASGAAE